MNTTTIMIQWERFKEQMPKIDTAKRRMIINEDFNLSAVFWEEDVDYMLDSTEQCLDAIRRIKLELGI